MVEWVDPIDPALRRLCPRACVLCDYALQGLPLPATCPECGTLEDPSICSLRGWAQRPTSRRKKTTYVWAFAAYGFIAMLLMVQWSRGRVDSFFVLYLILVCGWQPAYTYGLAFFRGVEGAPMRLRLSPAGFQVCIGAGRLKLKAWRPDTRVELAEPVSGIWMLKTVWTGNALVYRPAGQFIQFHFEAEAAQAEALAERVRRWLADAPPRRWT